MAGSTGVTPVYADLESALILPIDPPRHSQASASMRECKHACGMAIRDQKCADPLVGPVWRTGRRIEGTRT